MSFDYGESLGPHTWAAHFPAAGGKHQSPVNVDISKVHFDESLSPLHVDLKNISGETITRKAHNFSVGIQGSAILNGGPLGTDHKLEQFHFHWGSGNTWGSEHMINGVSHPAELHCVFSNKTYAEQQMDKSDGFAVVGIFLKLSQHTNPALDILLDNLDGLGIGEEKKVTPNLIFHALMPKDLSKYYTYNGSLTTPPCAECVTWILLADPIHITEDQLRRLRAVHRNCEQCGSTDNFRPICPLGRRRVRSSFPCGKK